MHVIIMALACLLGTILWQRDAVALDYPTHPVRVIIPSPPGVHRTYCSASSLSSFRKNGTKELWSKIALSNGMFE